MHKKILSLVISVALLSPSYIYAEESPVEATNGEAVAETIDESVAAPEENPVEEQPIEEIVYPSAMDINSDGATEEMNPVSNMAPTSANLFELTEVNFPDINFRNQVSQFDGNGDGWISEAELQQINWLGVRVPKSVDSIDLTGIDKFSFLENLDIVGDDPFESFNIKGIESINKLEKLSRILLRNALFGPDDVLTVPSLLYISDTSDKNLHTYRKLSNVKGMVFESATMSDLSFLKDFPRLESFRIDKNINLKSLNIPEENFSLQDLTLSGANIENLNGIEKYKKLQMLSISGGSIRDITPIYTSNLPELSNVRISGQRVEATKKYKINTIYVADEIVLPTNLGEGKAKYYREDGAVFDNNIIWDTGGIHSYNARINDRRMNGQNEFSLDYFINVMNVYPEEFKEGEWLEAFSADSIETKETFIGEKGPVDVIRTFTDSAQASLFATKMIIDGKVYTYSYKNGSDSTSRLYSSDSIYSAERNGDVKRFIKKEGGKNFFKTVTTVDINGVLLEKEEISYIEDQGIRHDVTYRNISDETLSNIRMYQMLDTMLNENDQIPIYADGKGNAYIISSDFLLYLEKVGKNGHIISGAWNGGVISETAKNVADYPKGTLLLDNADTAIYYGTDVLNLAPNEAYSYSYKETLFIDVPIIKAISKTIRVNEAWDPLDQLIGVYNKDGEELDRSKVLITHQANTAQVGVYQITFTYNKIYFITVTLTVVGDRSSPVRVGVPKTVQKLSIYSYAVLLVTGITLLIFIQKKKNN